MAYVTSTRVGNATLADRIAAVVKAVKEATRRRQVYNQTVRELAALNQRELSDLGIHASMIERIAREAAYGN